MKLRTLKYSVQIIVHINEQMLIAGIAIRKGDVGHLLFLSSNFGIFIICPSFNAVLPSIELNTST